MSEIVRCDRCGKDIKNPHSERTLLQQNQERQIDLCRICAESFKRWMNEPSQRKE
jgi:hypothetical protein